MGNKPYHKLTPDQKANMRRLNREWYARNKERQRTRTRTNLAESRRFLASLKANKPCMDCGTQYPPYVMDWDHVRGKKRNVISKMAGSSKEDLFAEIAKCDLVCSNCHRIRTFNRGLNVE